MPLFNQILIVGPGLLGASLGMAAKEKRSATPYEYGHGKRDIA